MSDQVITVRCAFFFGSALRHVGLAHAGWRLSLPDLRECVETGGVCHGTGRYPERSHQRGNSLQQPARLGGILSFAKRNAILFRVTARVAVARSKERSRRLPRTSRGMTRCSFRANGPNGQSQCLNLHQGLISRTTSTEFGRGRGCTENPSDKDLQRAEGSGRVVGRF